MYSQYNRKFETWSRNQESYVSRVDFRFSDQVEICFVWDFSSGRIYVGKAPPTFNNNGNTTEGAIVVGSPASKIQTAVNAVST